VSEGVLNAEYWNGEGGQTWVANIDKTEALLEPLSAVLIERAAARPGEAVLDVGCGGGRTTIELARAVGPDGLAVGLDISTPILEVARTRGSSLSQLDFQLGDASSMELGNARFDLIASRFGVMFFEEPVAAFENLERALKPTGRVVFMCWQSPEKNPWMSEPGAAAAEIVPPEAPPDPEAPGPFAFGNADRVHGILEQADFDNIEIEAVEQQMSWPDVDTAVDYITQMGPAGKLMRESDQETGARIHAAVRAVLARHAGPGGVSMPCATWIVKARCRV
jgi:SAM-dependent methyltransferase